MSASFPSANISTTVIPVELAHALDQTYFLHLLATDPARVLPPGKSILSVLSTQQTSTPSGERTARETLQHKVEDLVHRAFWDEALESLSSPEPSSQLRRLQHLYNDLLQALTPLFPRHHAILTTLSSPLSPTSSPLLSALTRLREILYLLRERCAPARDASIDVLLRTLDDPPLPANAIVNATRVILELSAAMKNDLSQFVIGQMDERQLRSLVVQQAREREREVAISLWSEESIRAQWEMWVTGHEQAAAGERWELRVLQALGSALPVTCNLPLSAPNGTTSSNIHSSNIQSERTHQQAVHPNTLPPPFLFTTPSLLTMQNVLQSLVVAASLRSLVHLPNTSPGDDSKSPARDFMQRIWALLKAEIDERDSPLPPGETGTKLVNLADEVVRARSLILGSELQSAEEARLRSAVERTLQYHDPVFLLLQKRLMAVLAERLLRPPTSANGAPDQMRTGRDTQRTTNPNLKLLFDQFDFNSGDPDREEGIVVKGFEDPVLVRGVGEALERIRVCITWVEGVWGALIERNGEAPIQ